RFDVVVSACDVAPAPSGGPWPTYGYRSSSIAYRSASRLRDYPFGTFTFPNSPSGMEANAPDCSTELRASALERLASGAEPLRMRAPVAATEAQGLPKGSRMQGRTTQWSRSHGRRDSPTQSHRRSLALQEKLVRPQSCESSSAGAPEPCL